MRGGGGRLHVREWRKADGPPILFIHGWSQAISACRSSTKVRSPTNFDSLPMTSVVTALPRDRSTSTGRGSVRGRVRINLRSLLEVDVPPLKARRR